MEGEAPSTAVIVLASASTTRAEMLRRAGVRLEVEPASVDEAAIRDSLRQDGATARDAAEILARMKTVQISARRPQSLVVGADQILECDGEWFDKPGDRAEARRDLVALRGRVHEQISAVCVAREGAPIWRHSEVARLHVRPFSDRFLEAYLDEAGEAVVGAVGAYRLEGLGVQLFSSIEGDFFAILGLPLLPLLAFLREHQVVGG